MRKLTAAILVVAATGLAIPASAADYIPPPPVIPPYVPPVDVGLEGSFYLRGSAGFNKLWAHRVYHPECIGCEYEELTEGGLGYSLGAGVGYETGTGLRVDLTLDHIGNSGLAMDKDEGPVTGRYTLDLATTLALANIYYDFPLSGHGHGMSAAGGAFAYVGAGAGLAFHRAEITEPPGDDVPDGQNTSLALAGMLGVGYDFGSIVADVGYRGVYMHEITNARQADYNIYHIEQPWLHEIRGTVRYRFN